MPRPSIWVPTCHGLESQPTAHSPLSKMRNLFLNSRQLQIQSPEMVVRNKAMITFNSPDMDSSIWCKLPLELLELILSFLPIKTLMHLRCTCKFFKTLIFSPSFLSRHSPSSSSSSPFSSFLLLSHPQCLQHLYMYDSRVGAWRNVSLPFSSSALLASSNGLLCLSHPNSSLVVCNLLTRSSRPIEFPTHPFTFELLTLVSLPYGYKIFAHSCASSSNSAFVYDSKILSWRRFDGFDLILNGNQHQQGVYFNGCLYFTTPEPFSVVCFDLECGNWERPNFQLPNQLTFVRLVSDGEGKLFMVGGVGRNGISRSVKLWEMSATDNAWIELETLPELMCRKFVSVCYHNYDHVYCFWHQGTLCICCSAWPEILYHKISRRTWHWLPKCPSLPERWCCGFNWFSFIPELGAIV